MPRLASMEAWRWKRSRSDDSERPETQQRPAKTSPAGWRDMIAKDCPVRGNNAISSRPEPCGITGAPPSEGGGRYRRRRGHTRSVMWVKSTGRGEPPWQTRHVPPPEHPPLPPPPEKRAPHQGRAPHPAQDAPPTRNVEGRAKHGRWQTVPGVPPVRAAVGHPRATRVVDPGRRCFQRKPSYFLPLRRCWFSGSAGFLYSALGAGRIPVPHRQSRPRRRDRQPIPSRDRSWASAHPVPRQHPQADLPLPWRGRLPLRKPRVRHFRWGTGCEQDSWREIGMYRDRHRCRRCGGEREAGNRSAI